MEGLQATDLLVTFKGPPEALDRVMKHFEATVVGMGTPKGPIKIDGAYVVRCFGDVGFLKFAIANQGYGKVIRIFDGLYMHETGLDREVRAK